jgi:uncharacterized membrane protein
LKNWQITWAPAVFLHLQAQTQLRVSENLRPLAYIYIYKYIWNILLQNEINIFPGFFYIDFIKHIILD